MSSKSFSTCAKKKCRLWQATSGQRDITCGGIKIQEIGSVELGICPMQLFHFWSCDVRPVQNLLLCTKFQEHPMIIAARCLHQARSLPSCGVRLYVCVYVCLSVTFVHSVKTGKHIVRLFSPSSRPITLVLSFSKPNGKAILQWRPPNGGVEYKGVWKNQDFWTIFRFVSKMMQDRAIVTMEGE